MFNTLHNKLCSNIWLTANTNEIVKKFNTIFLNIFCELNWDANLNGCELNREITVLECQATPPKTWSPLYWKISGDGSEHQRNL